MVFKVSVNRFSDVAEAIRNAEEALSNEVDVAQSRNIQSLESADGDWSEGADTEFGSVQAGLTTLDEGISDIAKACSDAADQLRGTLANDQSAVMDAVDSGLSDTDRVYCDDSADVATPAGNVDKAYGSLIGKVKSARGDSSSLNNDGGEATRIQSALDDLSSSLGPQRSKVSGVTDAWNTYVKAVNEFNDTFQGKFSQPLVTQDRISAGLQSVIDSDMAAVSDVKDGKKAAGEFKKVGKFIASNMEGFSDPDLMEQIEQFASKDSLSVADKADLKKLGGKLFLASKQDGAGKSYLKRFAKKLSPKEHVKESWGIDGWKDVASDIESGDRIKQIRGVSHGAVKGLGAAGMVLDAWNTAEDTGHAYRLAKGDKGDKLAAAGTAAVADGVDIGASYIAGAAIGSLFGGPVGAVVGIAAGSAISKGIDWLHKQKKYKEIKNDVQSGLGSMFHGLGVR